MVVPCSEVAMSDAEKESEARCKEMLSQLIAVVKKQTLEIEELAESMKELAVGFKAVVQPPGATAHAWPLPVPAPTVTLVTAVDHAVAAAAPRAEAALAPKPPTKCSTSGPDTNAGDLQVVAESDLETGVPTIAPALAEHSSAPSPKLFSTIKQDTLMPTRYSTICPDRSISAPTSVCATAVPPTSSSTIATLEIGNTFIANTILMKSTECPMECEEHAVDTDRRVTAAGIGTIASTNCLRECPRLVAGDISVTNLVIVASVTCIMGLQLKSPWPPPEQDRSRGSAEKRPTPWPSLKCYRRGASLDSASDDYGDAITGEDQEGKFPYPVPVYIDEGPLDEVLQWSPGDRFDISFYLMLLHANQDEKFGPLKTMFSAFSSSYDPLDYHMIWHQCSILEAAGAFSANDLHILDLSFVYQLLCLGKCYWAIYVTIHMPHLDDAPYIHEKLIRETLSQYCELWSKDKAQRQYIAELGIPAEWMHEALALYHEYYGDRQGALENFIQCGKLAGSSKFRMTPYQLQRNEVIALGLYFCVPFREQLLEYYANNKSAGDGEENMLTCLAVLFSQISNQKKQTGVIAPKRFVRRLKKHNEFVRSYMHQDAHEFLNFLLNELVDILEKESNAVRETLQNSSLQKNSNGPINGQPHGSHKEPVATLVHKCFQGILTNETRCLRCETVTDRDETLFDLSLGIEQNSSITSCLKNFSSTETLNTEDKFFFDKCCSLQEAQKRRKIKKPPNILVIHLKRFKYIEQLGRYKKLSYRVVFPLELKLINTVDNSDLEYSLFAVLVHVGSGPNHGPYISLVKESSIEEVAVSKLTIFDITKQICDTVQARAEKDKYHGGVLIPEGIVESIPELYALLQEIHGLHGNKSLQPHQNLKTLSIFGFLCRHFPTWLDDIGGLKSVGSEFCRKDASARGYQVLVQLEFSDMLEWAKSLLAHMNEKLKRCNHVWASMLAEIVKFVHDKGSSIEEVHMGGRIAPEWMTEMEAHLKRDDCRCINLYGSVIILYGLSWLSTVSNMKLWFLAKCKMKRDPHLDLCCLCVLVQRKHGGEYSFVSAWGQAEIQGGRNVTYRPVSTGLVRGPWAVGQEAKSGLRGMEYKGKHQGRRGIIDREQTNIRLSSSSRQFFPKLLFFFPVSLPLLQSQPNC